MDPETLKLVGFQQVLELLQGLAQTSAGRRVIDNFRPRSDSRESTRTLRMVEQLIDLAEKFHSFDLSVAAEGAVNASVELDNETMAPTFQLVFGTSAILERRQSPLSFA